MADPSRPVSIAGCRAGRRAGAGRHPAAARRRGSAAALVAHRALHAGAALPKWPALMATVERAARRVPRLRQRVVSPLLPISRPHWVADPDFELTYHLRHVRIPEPGGFAELMALAEVAAMAPLDPARPLWELTLVEGLRDPGACQGSARRCCGSSRTRSATGSACCKIALALLDLEPRAARTSRRSSRSRHGGRARKSRAALLRDRLVELPADLTIDALRGGQVGGRRRAARGGRSGARSEPGGGLRALARAADDPAGGRAVAGAARPRHQAPAAGARGAARGAQAGRARRPAARVNDAYLAGVLGAMRRYHEALGVDRRPAADGRSGVRPARGRRPASPRRPTSRPAATTSARSASPRGWGSPIPAERIREVHDLVAAGRAEPAHGATDVLARVFARTPQCCSPRSPASRASSTFRRATSPAFPARSSSPARRSTACTRSVRRPGVAVMFVLLSYNGTCGIGVTLDEAAIPDPALFRRCVAAGFDEVLRLGEPAKTVRTRGRRLIRLVGSCGWSTGARPARRRRAAHAGLARASSPAPSRPARSPWPIRARWSSRRPTAPRPAAATSSSRRRSRWSRPSSGCCSAKASSSWTVPSPPTSPSSRPTARTP